MTMRLDIGRLKAMAVALWREGGGNTLVKVTPRGTRPDPARAAGYCSTIKYILGRTPAEMEEILGFRRDTKLAGGAEVFRVDPLPSPEQFELRGYTQTPEGIPTDLKAPHPDYPPGLGVPQWELARYPQSGLVWLASVERGQRFAYPASKLPAPIGAFIADGQRR